MSFTLQSSSSGIIKMVSNTVKYTFNCKQYIQTQVKASPCLIFILLTEEKILSVTDCFAFYCQLAAVLEHILMGNKKVVFYVLMELTKTMKVKLSVNLVQIFNVLGTQKQLVLAVYLNVEVRMLCNTLSLERKSCCCFSLFTYTEKCS